MIKSLGGDLKKLIIILSLLLSLSMAQDYSLSFDGVDDYVTIPKTGSLSLEGANEFTIQIFINTKHV